MSIFRFSDSLDYLKDRGLFSKREAQTLTGKSSSSTRWLQRKASDVYTRRAHEEGFVARSAFKLQQILNANRRIRARTVVDLGASPGGWTQVALRRFRGSRIVSVDLKPLVAQEPRCTPLILDFLSPGAESIVKQALGDQPADLVMSDMAPSYSGQRSVDHMRLMELSNKALNFAKKVLRPGGSFICKASTGGEEPLFKNRLQKLFEQVKFIKPDSSFKDSTEIFVVAQNYQKIKRAPEDEAEQEAAGSSSSADNAASLPPTPIQEPSQVEPNTSLLSEASASNAIQATAPPAQPVSKPGENATQHTKKQSPTQNSNTKQPQKSKSSVRPSGIKSKKRKRLD